MTEHPTDDLGLYALGLLDETERRAIARHLAECDVCRAELAAHRSTVAALADTTAPTPFGMRARIVAQHRRSRVGLPALAYAAAMVLAVALVVSLALLSQDRSTRDEYARALAAVAAGARVVTLDAQGSTAARGSLVLSREGPAYLVLQLPPTPPGKGYEAWVIRGGVAIPAGMAPPAAGVITMQLHETLGPGDRAALTLEDEGGSQAPTSSPVLVGLV